MTIFNVIAPVFILIFGGTLLKKSGFLTEKSLHDTNKLVYWVGLPALLLDKTSQVTWGGGSAGHIFGVLAIAMGFCLIGGYGLSRLLKLEKPQEAAFVQASFRGNLAFIGLPIVINALSNAPITLSVTSLNMTQLQSLAVLSFTPLVPIYNLMAVITLVRGSRSNTRISWRKLIFSILSNPLIIACGVGLAMAIAHLSFPIWISSTLRITGQMALPLALLGVGGSLVIQNIRKVLIAPFLASLLKILGAPLIGWLIADWMGLSATERLIALLYLACPTATASYVMAQQLDCDEVLTSHAIIISTCLSMVALSTVLWICFGMA